MADKGEVFRPQVDQSAEQKVDELFGEYFEYPGDGLSFRKKLTAVLDKTMDERDVERPGGFSQQQQTGNTLQFSSR